MATRIRSVLLVSALGLALVSPLAAANITPAPGIEGSTTDLFDVSQGTTVTFNSTMHAPCCSSGAGPSTPQAALGGTDTFVESTHTIFNDSPPGTGYDFIRFRTPTHVVLSSYNLYLANDGTTYRGAVDFKLLGVTEAGGVLSVIDSGTLSGGDYVNAYGSNEILITNSASLALPPLQYFELQLTRAVSNGGPRVIELDGFGQAVPEPSAFVLAGCGLWALLAAGRRRRCA